jgi:hypothetical protein
MVAGDPDEANATRNNLQRERRSTPDTYFRPEKSSAPFHGRKNHLRVQLSVTGVLLIRHTGCNFPTTLCWSPTLAQVQPRMTGEGFLVFAKGLFTGYRDPNSNPATMTSNARVLTCLGVLVSWCQRRSSGPNNNIGWSCASIP